MNGTLQNEIIGGTRKGWVQGYNGQAAADVKSQVIVAQDVTSQENDVNQLAPMLTCCEAQAGRQPSQVVADAGYWSEANAQLGNGETELFVATTKDWKQRKELREKGVPRGRIPAKATAKDRMERKLLTKRGRSVYRQRGSTIEAVFGQMVTRGLTRFVLRGIEKVRQWSPSYDGSDSWDCSPPNKQHPPQTSAQASRIDKTTIKTM